MTDGVIPKAQAGRTGTRAWRARARVSALAAVPILAAFAADAATDCRLALAIGLDRSGSVDAGEVRLMVEGTALALEDPLVRAAFLDLPGHPVELAVFEWSGPGYQRLLIDWTKVDSPGALDSVASSLRAEMPGSPPSETAVGSAITYAEALLDQRSGCWRLVLDLAGDGKSNAGPAPDAVPFAPGGRPGTVNALVVGIPEGRGGDPGLAELTSYFRAHVLRGPGAFLQGAQGYGDFREAMSRKLQRELAVTIGESGVPTRRAPGPALRTAAETTAALESD